MDVRPPGSPVLAIVWVSVHTVDLEPGQVSGIEWATIGSHIIIPMETRNRSIWCPCPKGSRRSKVKLERSWNQDRSLSAVAWALKPGNLEESQTLGWFYWSPLTV